MKKPILVSGIQPTGRLHLGNYLGALKQFVELQNSGKYECYFFIADYHSLTKDFNPVDKPQQILNVAKAYLAAGLNPKKSIVFRQSAIPPHTELAWILNTITPLGELSRMTQFKDKAGVIKLDEAIVGFSKDHHKTHVTELLNAKADQVRNVGLFDYPVLMAADVLLYDAKFVPVGEDQIQHLELARTLARKFNSKFGATFIEPEASLIEHARVTSLDNPDKKMSKSLPSGCLYLDDSPEEIKAKIGRAVTDSGNEIKYDKQSKAGIANLLEIYATFSEKTIPELEKMYLGKGYGQFKYDLASIISGALKPFREAKFKDSQLKTILAAGAKKANKIASVKMKEIKKKIGIAL